MNNQQFLHSLLTMGIRVPAWEADKANQWEKENMSSFAGYLQIKHDIDSIGHCEPKNDRFPYQPKLCRRWWTDEHHRSCGHINDSAVWEAIDYDNQKG
jgi:hypothetical protein